MKAKPSFSEALRFWLKIGCISFGGPSGQIAILHKEIVETREWISEEEFVQALQFCMMLPGPEAQQLATWIGWRLHGIRGGIVSGTLFLLPSALLLWLLSLLYVMGQHAPLISAFFNGLKPAVVAIVFSALWRIGKRTLTTPIHGLLALGAFLLFCWHLSYPAVVLGSAILGAFVFQKSEHCVSPPKVREGSWIGSLTIALRCAALWLLPMGMLFFWLGAKALPVQIGFFFGKVAVLSFGGAYAALSFVSLHAVHDWGWMTSGAMMDGLGLAETTPGPLLMALQFVAFLAAYNHPGTLSPLLAATLGSLTALWSLFLPSFLWIFSLAPHMDRIASHRRVAGALSAIGSVVTAVIAYLACWFAGNLFFPHGISWLRFGSLPHIAWIPLILAVLVFVLLESKKIGIVPLILLAGGVGVLMKMVF